jgi:predicted RND superfamily exporter protein
MTSPPDPYPHRAPDIPLEWAYAKLVLGRPAVTLALLAAVFAGFAWFGQYFQVDVSSESLVLEHDADLRYYRAISARYGSDDYLIATYTPAADLFAPATLADLRVLRDELAGLERVESVISILDVPLLQSPATTLSELAEGWRTLLDEDTDMALARRELRESPLYGNRLLSPDGGTTALQINFRPDRTLERLRGRRDALREKRLDTELSPTEEYELTAVDAEADRRLDALMEREESDIARVREILDRHRGAADVHLGGLPMIAVDMMRFIRHDMLVFGLSVVVILAVLLAAFFRRVRWVVLPLVTAFATIVVTIGILGLVQWRVTVVSSNFIALLLIFSLSLSIHLIVRYRELRALNPGAGQDWLVRETVRTKVAPSFYTVATTMVAFTSLVVSGIRPVINFGWIMVVGLAVAFVFAFTLFPALLVMLAPAPASRGRSVTAAISASFARLAVYRGRAVMGVFALAVAFSVLGLSRLSVENRFIDYFHESTEIYQGMRLIDEKLGGTTPLDVVIDAPPAIEDEESDEEFDEEFDEVGGGITASSYWFNSFMLPDVADIHGYLDSLPETGKVLSLHTAMEVLSELTTQGEASNDIFLSLLYKRLPDEIKGQIIDPFLSPDGDQLRLAVRVRESDYSLEREALLERIRAHLSDAFGLKGDQVHLTGMLVLYNNLLQSLFRSQILTLGIVFGVILLTFSVVFRSFKVAAVAIVPNLIAASLVLGLLGGAGIPLDIMTITIAAITIGIAVDDTIHYVHRYREEWLRDHDYIGAIHRSHASIGLAMYYTTVTISAGFAVLTLSNFTPTIYFGLFTAFAMLAALAANMALLPVLMQRMRVYGDGARSDD